MLNADREWIDEKFESLRREVVKVQIDIATLKVKAGIWGLMAGAIPVVIMLGVYFVTKGFTG